MIRSAYDRFPHAFLLDEPFLAAAAAAAADFRDVGMVPVGPTRGGVPRGPPPLTLLSLLDEAEDPTTKSG